MAKVGIHSKTETVKVKKMVEVMVEEPKEIMSLRVYSVQYRNYPSTIHIQHQGEERNRSYGFAFDIPGQSKDSTERTLPSLAGTNQVYWPGALVVNGTKATLIGIKDQAFNVPMTDLPTGV